MSTPWDGAGKWLRCALHTHSTESDGNVSPVALAAAYEAAQFDVLAITDHWRLTLLPPAETLLLVPASELTYDIGSAGLTSDILVYGLHEIPDDPGGDRRNWLVNDEEHWEQRTFADLSGAARFAREQGAAAFVAHPYWTGLEVAPLLECEELDGLEIYNAGAELECGRGDSSMLWDAALEAGRPLLAIAADDAHVVPSDVGHAWTWVRAAERSPEAVVAALRAGLSYASAGPAFHEVHRDGAHVEVVCSPCRAVVLQMEREKGCAVTAGSREQPYGRVLETSEDGLITHAVIESPWPRPAYMRVRAVDAAGRSAWTNALWDGPRGPGTALSP